MVSDILFFIKNFKYPTTILILTPAFHSLLTTLYRSCGVKLMHNASSTNKECDFYFYRISHLWNSLPIIDLNLPISLIKSKIKSYLWQHFITNFSPDNIHKLRYLCPCSSCVSHHSSSNYILRAIITTCNINITFI